MTAEPLGKNTYKLTLDVNEAAAMPPHEDHRGMQHFICGLIDELIEDDLADIPEGRLLAEVFLRSDGSCVIFVTTLEQDADEHEQQLYSCDVKGAGAFCSLFLTLAEEDVCCAIYCGSDSECYRLIFREPPGFVSRICEEYGDYCEITQLFASRTAEYLTEILPFSNIRTITDRLR